MKMELAEMRQEQERRAEEGGGGSLSLSQQHRMLGLHGDSTSRAQLEMQKRPETVS
jgi:hypothetical protein